MTINVFLYLFIYLKQLVKHGQCHCQTDCFFCQEKPRQKRDGVDFVRNKPHMWNITDWIPQVEKQVSGETQLNGGTSSATSSLPGQVSSSLCQFKDKITLRMQLHINANLLEMVLNIWEWQKVSVSGKKAFKNSSSHHSWYKYVCLNNPQKKCINRRIIDVAQTKKLILCNINAAVKTILSNSIFIE